MGADYINTLITWSAARQAVSHYQIRVAGNVPILSRGLAQFRIVLPQTGKRWRTAFSCVREALSEEMHQRRSGNDYRRHTRRFASTVIATQAPLCERLP